MSGQEPGGHAHPTQDDRLVAALSEVVGGPVGTHAGPSRSRWTPLRVLLALTAAWFALAMLASASCAATSWTGSTQFSHVCTSQVADSYTDTGLVELVWPWTGDEQARSRYPSQQADASGPPALVGLYSYAAARATHLLVGAPGLDARYATQVDEVVSSPEARRERVVYMAVNAVGLALLALVTTALLVALRPRRPWDAALVALAPVVLLTALDSWALLSATAATGAVWAWARGRPGWAGVLVGVGAAAAWWPVLLLVAFAVSGDGLRRGARAAWLGCAATAVVAWLVVQLPVLVSGSGAWLDALRASIDPRPEGSVWLVLMQTAGLDASEVAPVAAVVVALWVVGVVVWSRALAQPPRLGQVAFLLVAGPALWGVSYAPGHALWLLPLAALARPVWRDHLVWAGGVVLFAAMDAWLRGGLLEPGGGGDAGFYWLAVGARLLATGWLVSVVARDMARPAGDPVRRSEQGQASDAPHDEGSAQETRIRSNVVAV